MQLPRRRRGAQPPEPEAWPLDGRVQLCGQLRVPLGAQRGEVDRTRLGAVGDFEQQQPLSDAAELGDSRVNFVRLEVLENVA